MVLVSQDKIMKHFLSLLLFVFLTESSADTLTKPYSFQRLWEEVSSDPLTKLPQNSLSYFDLFDGKKDLIREAAVRTLASSEDLLPYFNKLAHPNGICLRGVWRIDERSTYGGYFQEGSESLVIARASTAMSSTKRGESRAFAMAIKLFGTMDAEKKLLSKSANIFVIDDLGGSDAPYFMDVALTNEPEVSFSMSILGSLAYALKVAAAFGDADVHSGIRQLYEVSLLHEKDAQNVITPKYIKIAAQEGQITPDATDFREEFFLSEGEILRFDISVSSSDAKDDFKRIGTITFDASVVSHTCDHRLHFHHPVWRDDLRYNIKK